MRLWITWERYNLGITPVLSDRISLGFDATMLWLQKLLLNRYSGIGQEFFMLKIFCSISYVLKSTVRFQNWNLEKVLSKILTLKMINENQDRSQLGSISFVLPQKDDSIRWRMSHSELPNRILLVQFKASTRFVYQF